MKKYEYLEHTADIKFRAFGKTLGELYENSALAMFNSMSEDKILIKESKEFKVKGKDKEALMYNFLEELLFLFDSEGFFLSKIKVKINGNEILAKAKGDKAKKYSLTTDIKAVTYHEMYVRKEKNKFVAQVVLDI